MSPVCSGERGNEAKGGIAVIRRIFWSLVLLAVLALAGLAQFSVTDI